MFMPAPLRSEAFWCIAIVRVSVRLKTVCEVVEGAPQCYDAYSGELLAWAR